MHRYPPYDSCPRAPLVFHSWWYVLPPLKAGRSAATYFVVCVSLLLLFQKLVSTKQRQSIYGSIRYLLHTAKVCVSLLHKLESDGTS
jgi:hypothetical protein